jgi:hypothetical protein
VLHENYSRLAEPPCDDLAAESALLGCIDAERTCHAALKSRNHARLFSILFRDLTALSLH